MTDRQLHEFLQNPEIFGENLVPAHSDHFFYEKEKDIALGEKMPLKQSLNGTWKFKYSVNLKERPKDFYRPDFKLKGFANIKVPGHIEMQGYDTIHYTNALYPWDGSEDLIPPQISEDFAPVGSYVKEFKVAANLKDKPLFISFQGVETAFRVFVNGEYVGYSEDTFTPADFEITEYVTAGTNRLCVEVYKRTSASWLEDQDMWRFFGIFREVYLYAIPKLHVKDIFAKALLDENYDKGVLNLTAKLSGNVAGVKVLLLDSKGRAVFNRDALVNGDKATFNATGLRIKHWSAEEPNLYELRLYLFDAEGNISEIVVTKVGFRTFELKDKLMLINGKRIVFKGVDRHEFSATGGRVVSPEEMLWDIKTFKRNNINAVRTSHYPNSSLWYRLCDEYGIYMIDETNLETHGTWNDEWRKLGLEVPGSKPEWKGAVLSRAEHMFERDKNHAAVLMWSLGNESYSGTNFVAMHDYLRSVDDTRIVHYEGIVRDPDPEMQRASDMYSRMYARPAAIRKYLSENPDKPYVSCEYMHAMGNSLGGMKLYTDLEDEFPMYQGGFIWDYLDQAIWQKHNGKMRLAYGGDFGDRPTEYCFCTDGIVFADRRESPKCPEAKNLYANVRVTADDKGFTVENRNLFIDLSRYYYDYTVSRNGKVVLAKRFGNLAIKPGKTEKIKVETPARNAGSDYVYRVVVREAKKTKWCDRGFAVAMGESTVFAKSNPAIPVLNKAAKFIRTASGDGNVGVTGNGFTYIFSKDNGIVALRKDGKEYTVTPPAPTFFRAYTDNDRGYDLRGRANIWHTLSMYQKCNYAGFERNEEFAEVKYEYALRDEEPHATLSYRIFPDGRIEVKSKYLGKEGRPMLPLFGWELRVDKSFDNVEYFGKGPGENYRDRDNGVYTDVFKTHVGTNLTEYLVPQEAGNRTGVRYAKVTDKAGKGFMFAAESDTFEFGFLPFSAFEIENALHIDELPNRNYSWIRIMAGQMGVGGDDSWGAPVQEMFRLDSAKDMELAFTMMIL
ncbi:MAG: DUF4981 domain-containing protein [Lachnospiraceae bacterium]|nr:DUF4981 domain-containing protein [Lachnospiraceae bacterium]